MRAGKKARPPAEEADFSINATSDVKLNGRKCAFKEVPADAFITYIEVDPDTKAILRVHFSTGK